MKKYIHYCWFGAKPLPKLAKKCIKSWKKFLPDYEIKCWDESNVDLNECAFVKEAYASKKWAFVADYVRTKVMCEYGGIYFDTDMEIIKDISTILREHKSFLGVEDSKMIACGVWYEKAPDSFLAKEMLKFYRSQSCFAVEDMYEISIPRIISNILKDFNSSNDNIQYLKHDVTIFPRDYFYPLSYDHQNNVFTKNSCMIHYYDASWIPTWEQRENKIYRTFGKKNGDFIIKSLRLVKRIFKKIVKTILYPLIFIRKKRILNSDEHKQKIKVVIENINKYYGSSYLAFCNPNWFGVKNATKELFQNTVTCEEIYSKKDVELIGNAIVKNGIKLVIFSGFCVGWNNLVIFLHNRGIRVKTYFHGSHSQVLESYGWDRNMEIYRLHKKGYIDQMATCKQSLVEFYKKMGCDIVLLQNRTILEKEYDGKLNSKEIRIGIYAAKTDDWRKNVFSQLTAVSLLKKENVVVDMVPLSKDAVKFCEFLNLKIEGKTESVPRQELLERMSKNHLNLYVTFSECSPMLPLESFCVGVPCITGNNHHYFLNNELEKFLVIFNEDSPLEIKEKIELCLKERKKIALLSKEWIYKNNEKSKKIVEDFIDIGGFNE